MKKLSRRKKGKDDADQPYHIFRQSNVLGKPPSSANAGEDDTDILTFENK
jgi:hypothetical protein